VVKWRGLDGVDGVEGEGEEDGLDHGLDVDLSATYLHGRDPAGYSVEGPAGGFSDTHGATATGSIHASTHRTMLHTWLRMRRGSIDHTYRGRPTHIPTRR